VKRVTRRLVHGSRVVLLGAAVGDQLDADEQPAAAHVADDVVPAHHLFEARPQPIARPVGPFDQPIAQNALEDLEADRRDRMRASSRKVKPRSWQCSSSSGMVSTTASGMPAPSVFDRVTKSLSEWGSVLAELTRDPAHPEGSEHGDGR
jgi:hypothetical protein